MDPYSGRIDMVFPATLWLEGAGDLYVILSAIGSYLEKYENTFPEFEYLNTCDLYSTGRPDHNAVELFNRVYMNVIANLNGRGVLCSRVLSRENSLVLEIVCNNHHNIIYYPCPPL